MKGEILSLIATSLIITNATPQAATVALWDFNSIPPDANSATGSLFPVNGVGTASPLAAISSSFAAGSSSDPGQDNTGWNTSSYPAQGTGNKTAGVQFLASTLGYRDIQVQFEQRISATASRYARLQYTTNGVDFTDLDVISLPSASTFHPQSQSLIGIPGADNNPSFGFRIVAEFEDSATGAGTNRYVTPGTNSYASAGSVRFDLVRLTGQPIDPANTPPTIAAIADQTILQDGVAGPIACVIGDQETPAQALTLLVRSANPALLPPENILLGGSGNNRTITLSPLPAQTGSATVTILVIDGGGQIAQVSFVLRVNPPNSTPTISAIAHAYTLTGVATEALPFTIGDLETPADLLEVSAASSNPALVPATNILMTGLGEQRTITLVPLPGQTGTAAISIDVSDGHLSATNIFVLMVRSAPAVLVCESFDYPDGSLAARSGQLWATHGGTTGQIPVNAGQVRLSADLTEDVHIPLWGGPYPPESAVVLYVSLTVEFEELPAATGQYFAHYNTTGFRARLFASTEGAAPGSFRVGIANSSTTHRLLPTDLDLHQTFRLVARYDTATGQSALWVNPSTPSDPHVTADDDATPLTITSFSLRQQTGIGSCRLDQIMIATAFEQVVEPNAARLHISLAGDELLLRWPSSATGYLLQGAQHLGQEPWATVDLTPDQNGNEYQIRLAPDQAMRFFRLLSP